MDGDQLLMFVKERLVEPLETILTARFTALVHLVKATATVTLSVRVGLLALVMWELTMGGTQLLMSANK